MELPIGIQKEEFWQNHIERMLKFKGSQRAYAEQSGVTLAQLLYYRDKFRKKSAFAKVATVAAKTAAPWEPRSAPPAIPKTEPKPLPKAIVEKLDSYPQALPDAKWLAQLIRELSK